MSQHDIDEFINALAHAHPEFTVSEFKISFKEVITREPSVQETTYFLETVKTPSNSVSDLTSSPSISVSTAKPVSTPSVSSTIQASTPTISTSNPVSTPSVSATIAGSTPTISTSNPASTPSASATSVVVSKIKSKYVSGLLPMPDSINGLPEVTKLIRRQKDICEMCESIIVEKVIQGEGDRASQIEVILNGPPATPYAGGKFHVHMDLRNYPLRKPGLWFTHPVFHAAVPFEITDNIGYKICCCLNWHAIPNALDDSWKPGLTVLRLVEAVYNGLSKPNDIDHNKEAAELLKRNPTEFDKKAREYTVKYAE